MGASRKILSLALAAASANNIALAQSRGSAGALTLNGSTVTSGVATLDVSRRVLITSTLNDTGITFTIVGTDRYSRTQTETITGGNATGVFTTRDFLTVTSVNTSGATAGNVTVGTNGVASSEVMVVNRFIATQQISAQVVVSGTINYSVEVSQDDFSPDWDLVANTVRWFAPSNTANLTSQTANKMDMVAMPISTIRITQNSFSSGGTAQLTINVPLATID